MSSNYSSRIGRLLLSILTLACSGGGAFAQGLFGESEKPPRGEDLVTPSLILETEALVAGETNFLGINFRIEPGWHMYWVNSGDTGMPPLIQLSLPEGFEAGEIQWPTPQRYLHAGFLLDYIYEHEFTVIIPVSVPRSAANDEDATVAATIDWLVCEDVCLPGRGRFEETYRIEPLGAPVFESADAVRFEDARRRMPDWAAADDDAVSASWRGLTLELEAAAPSETIERMTFFPLTPEDPPSNIIEGGETGSDRLSLEYDRSAFDGARRVTGVVEIEGREKTSFHFIDVEAPSRGGA